MLAGEGLRKLVIIIFWIQLDSSIIVPDFYVMAGESVRVTSRPGQQLLGLNGRDEAHSVSGFKNLRTTLCPHHKFLLDLKLLIRGLEF